MKKRAVQSTWRAELVDPYGTVGEIVVGTPEEIADKARAYIFAMAGDAETPLPCSVRVYKVARRSKSQAARFASVLFESQRRGA